MYLIMSTPRPPSSPEALAVLQARKLLVDALATYNRAWCAMLDALQAENAALRAENAALRAQLAAMALAQAAVAAPPQSDDSDSSNEVVSSSSSK